MVCTDGFLWLPAKGVVGYPSPAAMEQGGGFSSYTFFRNHLTKKISGTLTHSPPSLPLSLPSLTLSLSLSHTHTHSGVCSLSQPAVPPHTYCLTRTAVLRRWWTRPARWCCPSQSAGAGRQARVPSRLTHGTGKARLRQVKV